MFWIVFMRFIYKFCLGKVFYIITNVINSNFFILFYLKSFLFYLISIQFFITLKQKKKKKKKTLRKAEIWKKNKKKNKNEKQKNKKNLKVKKHKNKTVIKPITTPPPPPPKKKNSQKQPTQNLWSKSVNGLSFCLKTLVKFSCLNKCYNYKSNKCLTIS